MFFFFISHSPPFSFFFHYCSNKNHPLQPLYWAWRNAMGAGAAAVVATSTARADRLHSKGTEARALSSWARGSTTTRILFTNRRIVPPWWRVSSIVRCTDVLTPTTSSIDGNPRIATCPRICLLTPSWVSLKSTPFSSISSGIWVFFLLELFFKVRLFMVWIF